MAAMASLRRRFGNRLKAIQTGPRADPGGPRGTGRQSASLIERGINAPSFEVLERMADRSDLQVRELFRLQEDGEDDAPGEPVNRITTSSRNRLWLVPVGLLCFHACPSMASQKRGRNSIGIRKRISYLTSQS
jgi:transcriptional regulator with XRE-family HTH domain